MELRKVISMNKPKQIQITDLPGKTTQPHELVEMTDLSVQESKAIYGGSGELDARESGATIVLMGYDSWAG